ncbi:g1334 [Coccomyxa elongata]
MTGGPEKIVEMQKLFQSSSQHIHLQGKNAAVNRLASVVVPSVLGLAALAVVVDGAHKLYTGKGKME